MFHCPLCELEYPGDVPTSCKRCKRPLIINGRYRIERPIEVDEARGEDFDVLDLKSRNNVILREIRVRKADMNARRAEVEHYHQNVERLRSVMLDGDPVLINAFEAEFKNSVCFYYVFTEDAWGQLGSALHAEEDSDADDFDDLDALFGDDGGVSEPAGASSETPADKTPARKAPARPAPPPEGGDEEDEGSDISDDDLAFLDSMLSDVDGGDEGGGGDYDYLAELEKKAGPSTADKGGAMVKATGDKPPAKVSGDKPPAKASSGGSALSRRPVQIAIGSVLMLIAIAIAVAMVL